MSGGDDVRVKQVVQTFSDEALWYAKQLKDCKIQLQKRLPTSLVNHEFLPSTYRSGVERQTDECDWYRRRLNEYA